MIFPKKLKRGDEIRVVAPSTSFSILSEETIAIAIERLEREGFKVTFSKNCAIPADMWGSSSIAHRVEDIHEAFSDSHVKAIFAVLGGFNANQLLTHLDYDLIKNNPKIFCGYSDITVLHNAITAKTGLVTYSGAFFSTWGMKKEFDYNLDYFNKAFVLEEEFDILPSPTWSDDAWYKDQEKREVIKNDGFFLLNKGYAEGTIYGGNLCTLNLLQGTEYMPDISDAILFLEEDDLLGTLTKIEFDRDLQSLIHLPQFKSVKALVIGRFQKKSEMDIEILRQIIATKEDLHNIPIVANVDFGHTNPLITFPIGGRARVEVDEDVKLTIIEH